MNDMSSRTYNALWWSAVGPTCQAFRQHGLLTDLTLIINKCTKFKVHKLILACASGYFGKIATQEQLKDVYYLDNINESDFQVLLNFMYGEPLVLTDLNVHGVLAAAKALRFDSALQHCQDFLHHMVHRQEVSITDESLAGSSHHPDHLDTSKISSTFVVSPSSQIGNDNCNRSTHSQDHVKLEQRSDPDLSMESSSQGIPLIDTNSFNLTNQCDNSLLSHQTYNSLHTLNFSPYNTEQRLSKFPSSSNLLIAARQSSVENNLINRNESPDLVIVGSSEASRSIMAPNSLSSPKTHNSCYSTAQMYPFMEFQCPSCHMNFKSEREKEIHMRIHINQVKPYTCEMCPFSTKYPQRLRLHRRLVHTHQGVKPFKCPYCPYKASVKSNCRKHVKTIHPTRDVDVITLFHVPE